MSVRVIVLQNPELALHNVQYHATHNFFLFVAMFFVN